MILFGNRERDFGSPFQCLGSFVFFLFFIRDLALFDRLNANMFEGTER